MEQGHKKLEIYQMAHQLAIRVHEMSLALPAIERFEEGSQIRRSSKSVSTNIVEGFALRRYRKEFVQYLFRAYGSAEETIEHLELLFETKSLADKLLFESLQKEYNFLCGKMMRFIQYVDKEFETPNFIKEPESMYIVDQKSERANSRTSKRKSQNPKR